ncbi:BGTF surface domain-containing protein [Haloarcula nitratireducens]|uniref:PGF-CTERM sorting domain-containing protein n=1 Tax=Haloarcula nitratireducens TaxID=2487749 RepID=A0AAW4PI72_9EURY|nr:BGTF surface domain-containing protein [Halomicroarcula nitratireducens]MBX0297812.1 PGF-CTERM sorting domain-containing protein [Halomicroarcula nitratireducens]
MTDTNEKIRSLFLTALMVFGVFAGTVAFAGAGTAASNLSPGTFYSGQEVTVDGLSTNTDYQVRTVDDDNNVDSLRRAVSSDGDGVVTFELDGRLSEGNFVLVRSSDQAVINATSGSVDSSDTAAEDQQFEVIPQDLTAEFDDDTAGTTGDSATVDYEISSDVRNDYNVNVSAEGLDADELESIFGEANVNRTFEDDDTIEIADAEGDYELDFSNVDTGNYTFEANVTDADASDSDTIEVVSTDDENAGFAQSVTEEQRGDVAEVTVQMENTDTALVQIGDQDNDGYFLTAEVEDGNDDGEVTLEFNSFTAGAVAADNVVSVADDDDSIEAAYQGGDFTNTDRAVGQDVLAATDYDLLATADTGELADDNTIDSEQSFATLSLTERSTEGLQVWTAPESALGDELEDADAEDVYSLVESNNLTQADTIAQEDAVVVQVQASGLEGPVEASNYSALSGVAFTHEIEAAAANPNSDSSSVAVANLTENIIYDEANDTHFVVIDSDDITGEFNHDDGDEYEANFTMLDTTDLAEDNTSVSDSFTIEDRDATLNDGEDITVEAAEDQQVTGQTNVAPGTELTVRMRSTTSGSPFLVQPSTYVGANGSYTATADFSDYSPGANFTAQTRISGDDLGDEVDGSIVEATNETDNETATPGTETPTDGTPTETGTEGGVTETATEGGVTETATEGGATPTEGGDGGAATETPTSGDGPGFTAAIALVALVAAALLAVRRDN